MTGDYTINRIVDHLRDADSFLHAGKISYKFNITRFLPDNTVDIGTAVWLYKERRFCTDKISKNVNCKTLYDGQDTFTISKREGDNRVTIVSGNKGLEYPPYVMTPFYPGPCFMMGRGLSLFPDLKVVSTNPALAVLATMEDGSTFTAELLPDQDFLAKSIIWRNNQDNVIRSWNLDSPVTCNQGPLIAAHCVQVCVHCDGNISTHADTAITEASCFTPNNSEFEFVLSPELQVLDRRSNRPHSVVQKCITFP